MWKLFLAILQDELGGSFLNALGLLGGSTMLGSLAGDDDEEEEIYDPYAGLRGDWQTWLQGKLGTTTPYTKNTAFDIEQPEVEKAAESSILGYFQNPTSNVKDYEEATKKYSDAAKASRAETYADEMTKTKDMYNRLGLVSSTPGLTAEGNLSRKQATESNLFDTELAYGNLDRQLSAMGLDVSQMNSMLGQAGTMAGAQTGREQFAQQMSMADIERMINEEMGYGAQAAGVLGSNPPERTVTSNPNIWSQLASTGSNVGQMMLLKSVLGL